MSWKSQGGGKIQEAAWSEGAEMSLSGLGLSWMNSSLAGLTKAADHAEKTLGRLCLVPLVCQPILVSSAAAETHLCLLGWGKGLGKRRGALVPAQAVPPHGLSALTPHVVGPRPWRAWLAAAWHRPTWLSPVTQHSLSSVSWLSCKGRDEPNPTELLQQATCQHLQVTASWAQEDWLAPCAWALLLQVLGRYILCERGPGGMAGKAKAAGGESGCGESCPSYLTCACPTCLFCLNFGCEELREF